MGQWYIEKRISNLIVSSQYIPELYRSYSLSWIKRKHKPLIYPNTHITDKYIVQRMTESLNFKRIIQCTFKVEPKVQVFLSRKGKLCCHCVNQFKIKEGTLFRHIYQIWDFDDDWNYSLRNLQFKNSSFVHLFLNVLRHIQTSTFVCKHFVQYPVFSAASVHNCFKSSFFSSSPFLQCTYFLFYTSI